MTSKVEALSAAVLLASKGVGSDTAEVIIANAKAFEAYLDGASANEAVVPSAAAKPAKPAKTAKAAAPVAPPAAEDLTEKVGASIAALIAAGKTPVAKALLGKFGATNKTSLPAENHAEFIKLADEALLA